MEVKIEIFILFDEEDRKLYQELKKHLIPLEKQGLIILWDKDQVAGGTNRSETLHHHLKSASLVLLLLSAHFIASYEAYELGKEALEMHIPPDGYVVPVILHPVDWEHSIFGPYEPLPANGKPISSWSDRHEAYLDVVKGIRTIIKAYNLSPSEPIKTNPLDIQPVTITTPDGNTYTADVPADTLVDQLLREFLIQWSASVAGTNGSMHFSLHSASIALDPSDTLRESGLVTNLLLVSEKLAPDEAISLRIEDDQGEQYTTVVLLNTAVGQLADAFLRIRSGAGKTVVNWIVSATKTKQLKLEESLYNQGVCDDALLRVYRTVKAVEE